MIPFAHITPQRADEPRVQVAGLNSSNLPSADFTVEVAFQATGTVPSTCGTTVSVINHHGLVCNPCMSRGFDLSIFGCGGGRMSYSVGPNGVGNGGALHAQCALYRLQMYSLRDYGSVVVRRVPHPLCTTGQFASRNAFTLPSLTILYHPCTRRLEIGGSTGGCGAVASHSAAVHLADWDGVNLHGRGSSCE
jgi:hypothetical protein